MATTATKPRMRWLKSFGFQVIAGLLAGLVLGFIARNQGPEHWLNPLFTGVGDTYVQILRLLIPVLVFTAVVSSVTKLREVTGAARLAGATIMWFLITAFFSVLIGIAVAVIFQPGIGSGVTPDAAANAPSHTGSWLGFIKSVIPANILGLTASTAASGSIRLNFNVLQILALSLAFGIAALKAEKSAEPFLRFSESLLSVVQVVLWWIIRLAPIGTAALIAHAVSSYGWEALGSLSKFALAIYLGLALVLFVLYPLVLLYARIPVMGFYRRVWPVTSLGFATRSSMGVMPVNQQIVTEKMGVSAPYAAFALPLGATTKMDGCAAIYPAVAAIFIAQFYNIPLDATHYLLIVLVAVLGSAATAGTTGATVMLTLTLSTLGLPLAGVGLLLSVEPIIDMGRTAVNVTGQALVAAVVAKRNNLLDEDIWEKGLDLSSPTPSSTAFSAESTPAESTPVLKPAN
ncbi:dicarboxylate/amino acid:cation symporter [Corynebacterium caspium]|uniref:dicarboxylate/amino acid:cation symporter n=1 Tax=Corynebacterium caspium TaxID=234828 RepID=UPI00036F8AE4|nr:dicarboxylate/amino acid:cation symporter [Corynebacterium caspium]WKD58497.1 C4-dicarboxylate transport protein [Corynebacterium caspium DSM 44850]